MKFSLNLFLATFLLSNVAFSQCTPDYDYFPLSGNFGLSPDSLPAGAIFEEYNQDLTFVLPLDTLYDLGAPFGEVNIVFEDYHITSISLPVGLDWVCNSYENDCHYDPTSSQYGCVNISGVPLQQGLFEVAVTVIATHELSNIAGTETISFSLPLFIESGSSENSGFAMNNFSGCVPLMVDFENNNPDMASYFWDFGNGNTSNLENPGPQVFTEPGTYVVNYTAYATSESSYTLESVYINGSDNWYDFVDDGTSNTPDHYFYILNQNGNVVYSSLVQDNVDLPAQFNNVGLILEDQTYSIQVWDDDTYYLFGAELGTDDNLGTLDFDFNSTNISGDGLSISFNITEAPPIIFAQVSDTIYVYDNPISPVFVYDESAQMLSLESDSLNVVYQWHQNENIIGGYNMASMQVSETGNYMMSAVNSNGCSAFSLDTFLVVCDSNLEPEIIVEGSMLYIENSSNLDCQWFLDGEEIFGEIQSQMIATQSGDYSVELFDQWGCEYKSQDVSIDLTSVIDFDSASISLYPNPASSYVELSLENLNSSKVILTVFDLQGREVSSNSFNSDNYRLDISQMNRGTYLVVVQLESVRKTIRLLVR
jgi:hypothetical protein